MDTSNLQFSSEIIEKIKKFYNSTSELLLLCGFSGCAKSELLNATLEDLEENTLVFKHLCFEHTTIDDFLLNFYDAFRKFSLEKKVSLKKSIGEGFAQKVSFYFKNIEKKSLIIVDNYELVSKNLEILNFLAHISKFENTKLVLVSRNKEINFFINQELKTQIIEIEPNSKSAFKQKLEEVSINLKTDILDEFYELSGGYELYLRMVVRYSTLTGISIEDLLKEFKRKETDFSQFVISKVVSLVPSMYFEFLKNLSAINHAVSIDFINFYNLGDTKQIEYLNRNLLISRSDSDIIIKGYFKEYFLNTFSVQEKFKIFRTLVEIYEQELTKSPRERLLRLSRESIRKQIEMVKRNIPQIGKQIKVEQNNFSYISLSQEGSNPWFDKSLMDKKQQLITRKKDMPKKKSAISRTNYMSDEDKAILKEYRKRKFEQEQTKLIENQQIDFNSALRMAQTYEENYQYSKANEILAKLKNQADDEQIKIEILNHLAHNSEKLNNFENAIDYYSQIASLHLLGKDYQNYFKTILECAILYKNLYRFNSAKEEFLKIVSSDEEVNPLIRANAYLGLGDVSESENSIQEALEYYKLAYEFAPKEEEALNAEIDFKRALLYDDMQDFDTALLYYQKNINSTQNSAKNKWLSQSYINSGLIYAYQNNQKQAVKYIKNALETDKKDDNISGVYFASRELAKIYEGTDIELALEYMHQALDCAKQIHDTFKIAFAHLEIGDLYYNFNQNELALENFFKAKKALGDNISKENSEIISLRINDMKIKMLPSEFNRIEAKYAE